jgi:hypothetical protein
MLLSGLVIFSPVELLTVNPFHLKKGSMLPASNDNIIELAAGKGVILSAPSQLHGLASKSQPWPDNSKMQAIQPIQAVGLFNT